MIVNYEIVISLLRHHYSMELCLAAFLSSTSRKSCCSPASKAVNPTIDIIALLDTVAMLKSDFPLTIRREMRNRIHDYIVPSRQVIHISYSADACSPEARAYSNGQMGVNGQTIAITRHSRNPIQLSILLVCR